MASRLMRSAAIFRLALTYWGDSRRIAAARRRLPDAEFRQRESEIYREGAIRFRETALRLGGLIIKVGQFLSARTDLLPLSFTRELTQLQDRVPEAPWPEVKDLMEREWGSPLSQIFAEIEPEPVAAASLGQVHRARLLSGDEAAVKVQRPGIDRLASIDLGALSVIMRVLERYTRVGRRINASRLFEEFEALVERELDYRQEADYLNRFRKNFADEPDVVVPALLPDLTRRRVFAMEFATGVKLTDLDQLAAWKLDSGRLGDILIRAYLKQIAVDGFVQIDPHAGNFFADVDGRIIFLDFGMMAEIPDGDLRAVAGLIQGILTKDTDLVVTSISDLGFVKPSASPRLLKRAVGFMLDRLSGTPLRPGSEMDRAVAEFQDFLYQEPLEFPARYMFLGRAIGMLFGLVSRLNPEIDWLQVLRQEALPLLQQRQRKDAPEWIGSMAGWIETALGNQAGALTEGLLGVGWKEAQLWAKVPGQMRRVLALLEQGELGTQPEVTGLLRRLDRVGDLEEARLALMWAGASGAIAWAAHVAWPQERWIVWVWLALSAVLMVQSIIAGRRARRRLKPR